MFKRKLLALATAAVLTAVTICASVQATEDQGVTSTEQTELSEDEDVATDGDIGEEPSEDLGDEDFGDEDFDDEDPGDEDFDEEDSGDEDEEIATDGDISEEPSDDEEDGDSSGETPDTDGGSGTVDIEYADWSFYYPTETSKGQEFDAAKVEEIFAFNESCGWQPLYTVDLSKFKGTFFMNPELKDPYEGLLETVDSSTVTGELNGVYATFPEVDSDKPSWSPMVQDAISEQQEAMQNHLTKMTVSVPDAKVGDTVTVVTWRVGTSGGGSWTMFKNSADYQTITVTKDGQVDISGYGAFPFAVYLDKAEAVVTPTPGTSAPEATVTPAPETNTSGNAGSTGNAGTTGGSVSGTIQTGTSTEVVNTLASTVIAAPTTEAEEAQFQNALVNNVKAADASGNDLAVTCIALTTYNQTAANTLIATVNASKVSGNLASLYEVNYDWDTYSYEQIQGKNVDKVTLTIPVADVKAGDDVTVVHWLAKSTPEGAALTGEVEYVKPSVVKDGEIVVTLKGLSPVAVYVDKDAASNAQTGSTAVTSPKTGNSNMGLMLAVFGAALMLVVTVFGKKTVR